ncbi:MAG: hypothetical protein NTV34_16575 [Proteobacteria bacterium]|nr:hypothetical protein [Pseudomonadota bacterium]
MTEIMNIFECPNDLIKHPSDINSPIELTLNAGPYTLCAKPSAATNQQKALAHKSCRLKTYCTWSFDEDSLAFAIILGRPGVFRAALTYVVITKPPLSTTNPVSNACWSECPPSAVLSETA